MLTTGYCSDLKKKISLYKGLPNLLSVSDFNKLVYVEEHENSDGAEARFKEVFALSLPYKKALIENVNPGYVELVPGVNYDLV